MIFALSTDGSFGTSFPFVSEKISIAALSGKTSGALIVDLRERCTLPPLDIPVVGYSADCSESDRQCAFAMSIAAVASEEIITRYGTSCFGLANPVRETVYLVDAPSPRFSMLQSLSAIFGIKLVRVESHSELFDLDHDALSMIFANITLKTFSVNEYIKRSHSTRLKFVPFVPFRVSDDWISISDILAGLNRVAKVIMSCDEMISFYAYLLSEFDIERAYSALTSGNESVGSVKERGIRSLYHEKGSAVFHVSKQFFPSGDNDVSLKLEEFRRAMIRKELVRWLIREEEAVPTCGRGV